ncbi:carbon monoxide dehydrogenase [Bradyrhizobium sp. SSBR45G]|uniref:FAD binding domain-containing protein n=1 Tax=unclassified Bradyrhizobium TaxID=2631580 RepID=UPI002342B86B|nr:MULTISPECIES: FAD binding domain-containing protein [unclassified Bradyrhizobium]GLH77216.1 carbon monoxide dehydrogenase [Bradyrhizobium sp. SSBR45G]GLH83974.1 carbon monoxide dehydrogenase [Bradyrhizobium sp. SSBR45R]
MKAASFAYGRPNSMSDALALLADADGEIRIMAGGQSLGPMLNLRLVQPPRIVDIAGLAELRSVERDGEALVIGACVTHADIEDGRIPDVTQGVLPRIARGIAYRAVRNRGTIGGSLGHADPAADWVTTLAALGASVQLTSSAGRRDLAVTEFIQGALQTALRPGELVTAIRLPSLSPAARFGYAKACRKPGEFAHAMAAVLIEPDTARSRIVIGAIDTTPIVIDDSSLFGGAITEFRQSFDRDLADRLLMQAGVTDPAARHIHVSVLARAIAEAAP